MYTFFFFNKLKFHDFCDNQCFTQSGIHQITEETRTNKEIKATIHHINCTPIGMHILHKTLKKLPRRNKFALCEGELGDPQEYLVYSNIFLDIYSSFGHNNFNH